MEMWPHSHSWSWFGGLPAGDEFRLTTETALESSYRAGQQKMVDDYRARYRTLTEVDNHWLWHSDANPLRDAMKQSLRQYADASPIPLDVLLTIKECALEDYWYQFQRAAVCTENG